MEKWPTGLTSVSVMFIFAALNQATHVGDARSGRVMADRVEDSRYENKIQDSH